jgi:hypothetical protein
MLLPVLLEGEPPFGLIWPASSGTRFSGNRLRPESNCLFGVMLSVSIPAYSDAGQTKSGLANRSRHVDGLLRSQALLA